MLSVEEANDVVTDELDAIADKALVILAKRVVALRDQLGHAENDLAFAADSTDHDVKYSPSHIGEIITFYNEDRLRFVVVPVGQS